MRSLKCKHCQSKETAAKHLNGPGCKRVTGKKHHFYKSGYTLAQGYRLVNLPLDSPFRCMADKHGRCREHRLVMAKKLGRVLKPWEIVHHKNRKRDDNRPSNLELVSSTLHRFVISMEQHIDKLEADIVLLRAENERLRLCR